MYVQHVCGFVIHCHTFASCYTFAQRKKSQEIECFRNDNKNINWFYEAIKLCRRYITLVYTEHVFLNAYKHIGLTIVLYIYFVCLSLSCTVQFMYLFVINILG